MYGQIAAANSLSDVYAMGGVPKFAMNLLCIPSCLSFDTVREILRGGYDKVIEAGCIISGGHTIEDNEPKYGLCVTGIAHPDKILRNSGAKPGDAIILTKPIGTGILTTGVKADLVEKDNYDILCRQMAALNANSQRDMMPFSPSSCTDVTGFALLGHAYEMASGSNVTIEIDSSSVPLLPQAYDLAQMGIIPAGAYRNMDYVKPYVETAEGVDSVIYDIMCDPQTSGGLLIALPNEHAEKLLPMLKAHSPFASIIGHAAEFSGKSIMVK